MNRSKLIFAALGALVAAGVLAAAGVWYFVIRDTSPPPVSLESAATAAGTGTASAPSDLTGAWSVVAGGASFAGYRVDENLVGFGSRTAVGRTAVVQGTLAYDGRTISSVHASADLTQLKSDQSLRDDTLKMTAIQSCQFPTASFNLATPITLDGAPADGATVARTVQGNLTLHGVTRAVSIDVKGQLKNGQLIVVGSTNISFADYKIEQPRSFFVVSLDDHGIMEFQLIFAKGGSGSATAAPQAGATPPAGCQGGGFPPPSGAPPGSGPQGGFPPPGGAPGVPGGGLQAINTPAPVPSPVN